MQKLRTNNSERKMKHINEARCLSSHPVCCVGSKAGFNYRADSPWAPRSHKTHKGHTVSSKDDVADRNDLLEMINGETVNMPNA